MLRQVICREETPECEESSSQEPLKKNQYKFGLRDDGTGTRSTAVLATDRDVMTRCERTCLRSCCVRIARLSGLRAERDR